MVQIIAGGRGKGKTRHLIEKANKSVLEASGSILYLDKNVKHMYELSSKIRLINVKEFLIGSTEAFLGFVCGLIANNRDISEIYLDSFLNLASLEGKNVKPNDVNTKDVESVIDMLKTIGDKYEVNFIVSISLDKETLSENIRELVIISL